MFDSNRLRRPATGAAKTVKTVFSYVPYTTRIEYYRGTAQRHKQIANAVIDRLSRWLSQLDVRGKHLPSHLRKLEIKVAFVALINWYLVRKRSRGTCWNVNCEAVMVMMSAYNLLTEIVDFVTKRLMPKPPLPAPSPRPSVSVVQVSPK